MGVEDIRGKLQKNYKIGNFEGASIWLKQALDR